MSVDEVVLVDKPAGMTSFGVVARIRRKLSEEARHRVKVGHTGTLDPFATGLMIVLTGKQTKEAEKYTKLDKVYEATIELGARSTTGDPEGDITVVSDRVPTRVEIEEVLSSFKGEIDQTPPVFSAIKIAGQRAYKLARAGKLPSMPTRKVNIYSIELTEYEYPTLGFTAHVSSGTYIRSLAEDIGTVLGVGAFTTALRRTRVGSVDIKNAKTLPELGINN